MALSLVELQAAVRAERTEAGERRALERLLQAAGYRKLADAIQTKLPDGRTARVYLYQGTPLGDLALATGRDVEGAVSLLVEHQAGDPVVDIYLPGTGRRPALTGRSESQRSAHRVPRNNPGPDAGGIGVAAAGDGMAPGAQSWGALANPPVRANPPKGPQDDVGPPSAYAAGSEDSYFKDLLIEVVGDAYKLKDAILAAIVRRALKDLGVMDISVEKGSSYITDVELRPKNSGLFSSSDMSKTQALFPTLSFGGNFAMLKLTSGYHESSPYDDYSTPSGDKVGAKYINYVKALIASAAKANGIPVTGPIPVPKSISPASKIETHAAPAAGGSISITWTSANGLIVYGNTFPYKETIKSHGFKWSGKFGTPPNVWYLPASKSLIGGHTANDIISLGDMLEAELEKEGASVALDYGTLVEVPKPKETSKKWTNADIGTVIDTTAKVASLPNYSVVAMEAKPGKFGFFLKLGQNDWRGVKKDGHLLDGPPFDNAFIAEPTTKLAGIADSDSTDSWDELKQLRDEYEQVYGSKSDAPMSFAEPRFKVPSALKKPYGSMLKALPVGSVVTAWKTQPEDKVPGLAVKIGPDEWQEWRYLKAEPHSIPVLSEQLGNGLESLDNVWLAVAGTGSVPDGALLREQIAAAWKQMPLPYQAVAAIKEQDAEIAKAAKQAAKSMKKAASADPSVWFVGAVYTGDSPIWKDAPVGTIVSSPGGSYRMKRPGSAAKSWSLIHGVSTSPILYDLEKLPSWQPHEVIYVGTGKEPTSSEILEILKPPAAKSPEYPKPGMLVSASEMKDFPIQTVVAVLDAPLIASLWMRSSEYMTRIDPGTKEFIQWEFQQFTDATQAVDSPILVLHVGPKPMPPMSDLEHDAISFAKKEFPDSHWQLAWTSPSAPAKFTGIPRTVPAKASHTKSSSGAISADLPPKSPLSGAFQSAAIWQAYVVAEVAAGLEKTGSKPGGALPGYMASFHSSKILVKFPKDTDGKGAERAANEVLACALYRALGIHAPDCRAAMVDGKPAVLSPWIDGYGKVLPTKDVLVGNALAKTFPADAWLANYDVVGLEYDNLLGWLPHYWKDNPTAPSAWLRVDNGGALLYRAQGEPKKSTGDKTWGPIVVETTSMLDPKVNPQAAAAFHAAAFMDGKSAGVPLVADILKLAAAKVYYKGTADVPFLFVLADFAGFKPPTIGTLSGTLTMRAYDLATQYGVSTTEPKKSAKSKDPLTPKAGEDIAREEDGPNIGDIVSTVAQLDKLPALVVIAPETIATPVWYKHLDGKWQRVNADGPYGTVHPASKVESYGKWRIIAFNFKTDNVKQYLADALSWSKGIVPVPEIEATHVHVELKSSFKGTEEEKKKRPIALALLTDGNRILLVRRADEGLADPGVWSLPGGSVDKGEDAITAAKRELSEELGHWPTGATYSGFQFEALFESGRKATTVIFTISPKKANKYKPFVGDTEIGHAWETSGWAWAPISELRTQETPEGITVVVWTPTIHEGLAAPLLFQKDDGQTALTSILALAKEYAPQWMAAAKDAVPDDALLALPFEKFAAKAEGLPPLWKKNPATRANPSGYALSGAQTDPKTGETYIEYRPRLDDGSRPRIKVTVGSGAVAAELLATELRDTYRAQREGRLRDTGPVTAESSFVSGLYPPEALAGFVPLVQRVLGKEKPTWEDVALAALLDLAGLPLAAISPAVARASVDLAAPGQRPVRREKKADGIQGPSGLVIPFPAVAAPIGALKLTKGQVQVVEGIHAALVKLLGDSPSPSSGTAAQKAIKEKIQHGIKASQGPNDNKESSVGTYLRWLAAARMVGLWPSVLDPGRRVVYRGLSLNDLTEGKGSFDWSGRGRKQLVALAKAGLAKPDEKLASAILTWLKAQSGHQTGFVEEGGKWVPVPSSELRPPASIPEDVSEDWKTLQWGEHRAPKHVDEPWANVAGFATLFANWKYTQGGQPASVSHWTTNFATATNFGSKLVLRTTCDTSAGFVLLPGKTLHGAGPHSSEREIMHVDIDVPVPVEAVRISMQAVAELTARQRTAYDLAHPAYPPGYASATELFLKPEKVRAAVANPARGTQIQSLLFDRDVFSAQTARSWAFQQGFETPRPDVTGSYIRLRQAPPHAFREGSFRTIELTDGVKAITAVPL